MRYKQQLQIATDKITRLKRHCKQLEGNLEYCRNVLWVKNQTEYLFVSHYPRCRGIWFKLYEKDLARVYDWTIGFLFWEVRRWRNKEEKTCYQNK